MECQACGHENIEAARFCANCGATVTARREGDDPLIGQTVGGRYRITRVLGEGGMGIVYEGEQQMGTTVRKVAVKTLHSELSRDPSVTARFHRECGTVAQLEHPNTIKVYDFGTMDNGTLYIAMEFLAGKSLDKVILEAGPMTPKRVLHLLQQIAGSLEEAHGQGIVHRDLKPENVILVDRAGEKDVVKLLDFGIAARTESASAEREAKLTQQGMVLGTPPYMSPEQFTGKALDRRSDIYSLGIMAYEMLTGRLPFEATTPWQWATEHMTAQPRPFDTTTVSAQIPLPMRSAILKALAKDREERFPTVGAFVEGMSASVSANEAPRAPAHSVDATRATAAMEEVPNFGTAVVNNPTAAMPQQPTPARVVAAQPAAAATPAGKPTWIWGVGAAVLLGGGGLTYALTSGSSGSDGVASSAPSGNVIQFAAPSSVPAVPPAAAEPSADEPVPDPEPEAEPDAPTKPGDKKPAGKPKPAGAGTPAKTAAPAASAAPAGGKPGGDACARCAQAVMNGDFAGAAAARNACTDSVQKGLCENRARGVASSKIRKAAADGNCPLARQIQTAAAAMGVQNVNMGACK
jgi:serine/threonine-protein kinase